jgi:hypothetical protein
MSKRRLCHVRRFRPQLFALLASLAAGGAGPAHAQQPPPYSCGDIPNPNSVPKIQPTFRTNAGLNNGEFDCMAWQDFVYFMWPAQPGQRGAPKPSPARLGDAGPTVWETYRTVDTVFLPNAQNPGPWNQAQLMATLRASLAQQVSSGVVRHLTMTSKVSRAVLANILRSGAATPANILDEIAQAGGGTLYDLSGNPVYYEVAMNQAQYDYIVTNSLYDANKQSSFAQTNVIALPGNTVGAGSSVEVKAAWKILSAAEKKSGRFHTTQALIQGSLAPVTVGLVGFHAFISRGDQGGWATFAQVDNAPVQAPVKTGTFNFFNPKCTGPADITTPCPYNVKDADPGQVVQITPDDATADRLNAYMHTLLKQYDPKSPWQYYNLVNVQWPKVPVPLSSLNAPVTQPLPDGTPNDPTLVNAVLETFLQQSNVGCIECHQYASTAASGGNKPTNYAGYSFMFGRASTPQ